MMCAVAAADAEPSAVVAPLAAAIAAAGVAAASAVSIVAATTTTEVESDAAEWRSCWMLQSGKCCWC